MVAQAYVVLDVVAILKKIFQKLYKRGTFVLKSFVLKLLPIDKECIASNMAVLPDPFLPQITLIFGQKVKFISLWLRKEVNPISLIGIEQTNIYDVEMPNRLI